jgi:hypothetical protein
MGKAFLGTVLLIAGAVALYFVYGMRPAEGLGDVARIVVKGQDTLKEPYYQIAMGVSSAVSLIGLVLLVIGVSGKK